MKQTDSKTLADALRVLARDIQSYDGVANACIAEAADRIDQLHAEVERLTQNNSDLREKLHAESAESVRFMLHDHPKALAARVAEIRARGQAECKS